MVLVLTLRNVISKTFPSIDKADYKKPNDGTSEQVYQGTRSMFPAVINRRIRQTKWGNPGRTRPRRGRPCQGGWGIYRRASSRAVTARQNAPIQSKCRAKAKAIIHPPCNNGSEDTRGISEQWDGAVKPISLEGYHRRKQINPVQELGKVSHAMASLPLGNSFEGASKQYSCGI